MLIGQETNEAGDCDDFGTPPSKVFDPEISLGAVAGIYENFGVLITEMESLILEINMELSLWSKSNNLLLIDAKFAPMRVGYIWNNIIKTGKARRL